MSDNKVKVLTLVFVLEGGKILLGLKKRGFGSGWWNGFGGKVNQGETIEDGARRYTCMNIYLHITEYTCRSVIDLYVLYYIIKN